MKKKVHKNQNKKFSRSDAEEIFFTHISDDKKKRFVKKKISRNKIDRKKCVKGTP